MLKIATWNVNSLRVRLPHVLTWLAQHTPEVLALQETKLEDKDFPLLEVRQAGYEAVYLGQKTYNGVALSACQTLTDISLSIPQLSDTQARVVSATINGVRVINLYVPNGASVNSEKYHYKLTWLAQVSRYIQQQLAQYPQLIVLGDLNIAPEDRDVYDPESWEGNVLVSEPERAALRQLLTHGLCDSFRLFEQEGGHYSWWDYRMGAWRRNQGLRIDHILISDHLRKQCIGCQIDKTPRGWERPSDHVPVVANFHL